MKLSEKFNKLMDVHEANDKFPLSFFVPNPSAITKIIAQRAQKDFKKFLGADLKEIGYTVKKVDATTGGGAGEDNAFVTIDTGKLRFTISYNFDSLSGNFKDIKVLAKDSEEVIKNFGDLKAFLSNLK